MQWQSPRTSMQDAICWNWGIGNRRRVMINWRNEWLAAGASRGSQEKAIIGVKVLCQLSFGGIKREVLRACGMREDRKTALYSVRQEKETTKKKPCQRADHRSSSGFQRFTQSSWGAAAIYPSTMYPVLLDSCPEEGHCRKNSSLH
jgi:hypothetical protein